MNKKNNISRKVIRLVTWENERCNVLVLYFSQDFFWQPQSTNWYINYLFLLCESGIQKMEKRLTYKSPISLLITVVGVLGRPRLQRDWHWNNLVAVTSYLILIYSRIYKQRESLRKFYRGHSHVDTGMHKGRLYQKSLSRDMKIYFIANIL